MSGPGEVLILLRFARVDGLHEHFVVEVTLGLAALLRRVGDRAAVRRPGGLPVIARPVSQLPRLAGRQLHDEQLARAIVEVALAVPFEQEAVRLDRRRNLARAADAQADFGDHGRAFAVGRKIEIADATRNLRDLPRAAGLQRPQLGRFVPGRIAEKEQRTTVAAIPRLPFARRGSARELGGFAAVPAHRPEVARALVALLVVARHAVGDGGAIGREGRLRDPGEQIEVVELERRRRVREQHGKRGQHQPGRDPLRIHQRAAVPKSTLAPA